MQMGYLEEKGHVSDICERICNMCENVTVSVICVRDHHCTCMRTPVYICNSYSRKCECKCCSI